MIWKFSILGDVDDGGLVVVGEVNYFAVLRQVAVLLDVT